MKGLQKSGSKETDAVIASFLYEDCISVNVKFWAHDRLKHGILRKNFKVTKLLLEREEVSLSRSLRGIERHFLYK